MPRNVVVVAAAALATILITPAFAAPASPELGGISWDGPTRTLQGIVDTRYGVGHVNVSTDYIGAHPGDVDPWFWVGDQFSAYMVHELTGSHFHGVLAWYQECGARPEFPGGGIVFDAADGAGISSVIAFPQSIPFGFVLDPMGGHGRPPGHSNQLIFTNHLYNDGWPRDPDDHQAPRQGHARALVFDVSAWSAPDTWLVCFEERDPGADPNRVEPEHPEGDACDMVFEVRALGTTPVKTVSFGALKHRYRH